MTNLLKSWMRPKSAATYADVSERTVWSWFARGLPHVKVSGITLVKAAWIDEWLEAQIVSGGSATDVDKIVREVVEGKIGHDL